MNVSLQVFVSNMLVQVLRIQRYDECRFMQFCGTHLAQGCVVTRTQRADTTSFFYLSYCARELVTHSWFSSCLLRRVLATKVGMAARHKQITEDSRLRSINGWDILIPCLPYSAWRMLMAFLQLDCAFSHCVVPAFHHDGHITVRIVRREPSYVRNLMLELRE